MKKFKKNNGDLLENAELILQNDHKQGLIYIVVRLAATKNTIFSGFILEKKSSAVILNNKPENILIQAFEAKKDKSI